MLILDKCLEHLHHWITTAGEPKTSLPVACLDLFNSLGPDAVKFIEDLTAVVMKLDRVERVTESPYLPPFVKFLNRYAVESVNFFMQQSHRDEFDTLFRRVLAHEDARRLRYELTQYVCIHSFKFRRC